MRSFGVAISVQAVSLCALSHPFTLWPRRLLAFVSCFPAVKKTVPTGLAAMVGGVASTPALQALAQSRLMQAEKLKKKAQAKKEKEEARKQAAEERQRRKEAQQRRRDAVKRYREEQSMLAEQARMARKREMQAPQADRLLADEQTVARAACGGYHRGSKSQ